MHYPLAPLYCRPWTLQGMTPRLIESHYELNYGGVVRRLNAISDELAALDPGTTAPEVIHRLKRDEFVALNSMLLHELYFASLGGDGRAVPEAMAAALAQDFGSVARWRDEFVALATGLGRACSTGWVLLTYVPRDRRLINQVATDDGQMISGAIPILALDMYEHAYHIDFGANASAYIACFMRNIEWNVVQTRYTSAAKVDPPPKLSQPQFGDVPAVTAEEVEALVTSGAPVQILDVRPRHYATRAPDIMKGAVWRDPERIGDWIGELSKELPVVTFCVYGFHIGCETAVTLHKAGFDARYMSGGHYAWKAIQGPVTVFDKEALEAG